MFTADYEQEPDGTWLAIVCDETDEDSDLNAPFGPFQSEELARTFVQHLPSSVNWTLEQLIAAQIVRE